VPGIMATRTIKSRGERIATIMTAPFMLCGAKVTAFLVLAGAFFPRRGELVMFVLTITSWFFVLVVARILRWTVIPGPPTPFVMELPPYRMPTLYGVLLHTWERVWQYIKKAGTLILAISVVIWAFMTFPRLPDVATDGADTQASQEGVKVEARALRHSLAGRVGQGLEPVTRYAGFTWQANIALMGALAAKEVFVSTLATAYSLGEEDPEATEKSLTSRLAKDPAYTMPAVFSLFAFLLLYSPCIATSAIIAREAGWRWAVFGTICSVLLSFLLSVLIYQVGTLLSGATPV